MSPKRFIIHFKSTHIYQISAAGYNCLCVRFKKKIINVQGVCFPKISSHDKEMSYIKDTVVLNSANPSAGDGMTVSCFYSRIHRDGANKPFHRKETHGRGE